MYPVTSIKQKGLRIFVVALTRTGLIGMPLSVLLFWLASPHGGVGGYFIVLGLAVLWPVYLLASEFAFSAEPTMLFWIFAVLAQAVWMLGVFCFIGSLCALRNSRKGSE